MLLPYDPSAGIAGSECARNLVPVRSSPLRQGTRKPGRCTECGRLRRRRGNLDAASGHERAEDADNKLAMAKRGPAKPDVIKPSLFIGSSTEGMHLAEAAQAELS